MFMIFLLFFSSEEHLQLFVDYMNKQHKHKCLKSTSEAENDNSFPFLENKITRQSNQFKTSGAINLKHLVKENHLSVVHIRTMKVI